MKRHLIATKRIECKWDRNCFRLRASYFQRITTHNNEHHILSIFTISARLHDAIHINRKSIYRYFILVVVTCFTSRWRFLFAINNNHSIWFRVMLDGNRNYFTNWDAEQWCMRNFSNKYHIFHYSSIFCIYLLIRLAHPKMCAKNVKASRKMDKMPRRKKKLSAKGQLNFGDAWILIKTIDNFIATFLFAHHG